MWYSYASTSHNWKPYTFAGAGSMIDRKVNLGPLTIDLPVAQARMLSLRRMIKYTWEQTHIHSVMCRFHPLKSGRSSINGLEQ